MTQKNFRKASESERTFVTVFGLDVAFQASHFSHFGFDVEFIIGDFSVFSFFFECPIVYNRMNTSKSRTPKMCTWSDHLAQR